MKYGEIIIGPPGSGKTTYILEAKSKLTRKHTLINLDPGNTTTNIFHYNITEYFTTNETMETDDLGPNGAVMKIFETIKNNIDDILGPILNDDSYFIIDFPGQLEFFISNDYLKTILNYLKIQNVSFVVVNLFDCCSFYDDFSRVTMYLIATLSILMLESPHVCVISKCDNVKKLKGFDLEEVLQGSTENIEKTEFNKETLQFIEGYSLLAFQALDVANEDAVLYLQYIIDISNGFAYEDEENTNKIYANIKPRDEIIEMFQNFDN